MEDKKGEGVVILDVRGLSSVTDFFVICTATSERHSRTLAEHIRKSFREENIMAYHVDGLPEGLWVVVDYIEFILHIFVEEKRKLYALEKLWGDAKRIE